MSIEKCDMLKIILCLTHHFLQVLYIFWDIFYTNTPQQRRKISHPLPWGWIFEGILRSHQKFPPNPPLRARRLQRSPATWAAFPQFVALGSRQYHHFSSQFDEFYVPPFAQLWTFGWRIGPKSVVCSSWRSPVLLAKTPRFLAEFPKTSEVLRNPEIHQNSSVHFTAEEHI